MSKRIFTGEQIEELLANENIAKCSEKAITYERDFKIRAVKQYNEDGMTAKEIFRQAGLDLNVIGRKQPKECLRRWNRIFRKKGIEGLSEVRGKNGGRPKTRNLTGAERMKKLEAEVAYLKAENDFLAKLRAGRRK
jgi:transposase-like protein